MKILLINYRFYEAGGAERYLFNVSDLLEKKGHTVIPFSLRFNMNRPSPYEQYFADPPGGDEGSFYYKDVKKNVGSVMSLLGRQFYSKHVYDRLIRLIRDTKPDVAYVLHFLHKMSPSVIDACADQGVPVVVRLSDYGLICPKNIFYRNDTVCELCQTNLLNSVRYGCVQGSKVLSAVNYLAYQFHYIRGLPEKIRALVCPSEFMLQRFKVNREFRGVSSVHIPTFVHPTLFDMGKNQDLIRKNKHIVYWGRISHDKGIGVVLESMKLLSDQGYEFSLDLIGQGSPDYINRVQDFVEREKLNHVTLIPYLNSNELFKKVQSAEVALVPSIWYDNMPNSLLEAQALGIPVIASNLGSLPEMIEDGRNGFLFDAGDAESLAATIRKFFSDASKQKSMNIDSHRMAIERYHPEIHYKKLMALMESTL